MRTKHVDRVDVQHSLWLEYRFTDQDLCLDQASRGPLGPDQVRDDEGVTSPLYDIPRPFLQPRRLFA